MKQNLYVIYDSKANTTTPPFSCPTHESAKRNFIFGCLTSQTPIEDCVLFHIGEFVVDDEHAETFSLVPHGHGYTVITVSQELIESYKKIFLRDFEEFEEKGVID